MSADDEDMIDYTKMEVEKIGVEILHEVRPGDIENFQGTEKTLTAAMWTAMKATAMKTRRITTRGTVTTIKNNENAGKVLDEGDDDNICDEKNEGDEDGKDDDDDYFKKEPVPEERDNEDQETKEKWEDVICNEVVNGDAALQMSIPTSDDGVRYLQDDIDYDSMYNPQGMRSDLVVNRT